MVELVDEADLDTADRGALLVGQAVAITPANLHLAAIRVFQKACEMQEGRFAGAGRCDERDDLAGSQFEIGALEDRQFGIAFAVVTFYARELQDGFACHEILPIIRSGGPARGRALRPAMRGKWWR